MARALRLKAVVAAVICGPLLLIGGTASAADTSDIKVGMISSLSGPAAPYGVPERNISQILEQEVNENGGIRGRKIKLIYADDATNPTKAAQEALRLINQDEVVAILGTSTGSGTLALAPIAAAAKVPVFAPVATQSVTRTDNKFFPWVFRAAPASAITIRAIVEKLIVPTGYKRVGVMYQEDAYGKEEYKLTQAELSRHKGIEIVEAVSGALSATDLTPQATRLRNAKPDVVLLLTSAPELGGAFARAVEQAKLEAPVIGSLSINQSAFVQAAGKAGNGFMSVTMGNWDEPSAKQKALGALLAKHGKTPEGYAEAIGSAAFQIFVEAMKSVPAAKELNGQNIRDAAETICNFSGTYLDGDVCYTADQHDGYGPETVNIVQLHDGHWKNVNLHN